MFEDRNQKRTEINQLGEFGLIDHLTQNFENKLDATICGVGDDAAVIGSSDLKTLISKEVYIEGVHFDLGYHPLGHLGYKVVVAAISDILAMNAIPQQIMLGIGISNRFSIEALEEFYQGVKRACDIYKLDLVGGDTSSSNKGLVISISAMGQAKAEDICYRKGASAGDLLCTTGDLGSAYMGLLILEREKAAFQGDPNMQPDFSGMEYILERQLKPEARKDVISMLADLQIKPTSMIDISDGLASEIKHLVKHNKLGVLVYEDKLPIDSSTYNLGREWGIDPTTAALNGGEDYELLFTIKQEDYEKVKHNPDIVVIGHLTDNEHQVDLVAKNGVQTPIKAQGWDKE